MMETFFRRLPLLLLAPLLLGAGGLTPQEERGRHIYVDTKSPSGGEITAVLGEGVEVEGAAVNCASCHGRDGKGRPEGGVTPTDITWATLTRPYGVTHPGGRRHPPYDERTMKRSLTLGFDPAGNTLHVAMPRYRMSRQDMEDLVAYLKTLGRTGAPGVDDAAVRVGVLLPPPGAPEGMGKAVRSALEARFAAANAAGGLYGRRLEPRFLDLPALPGERKTAAARFLESENVFAVAAPFLAGADADLAALFQEKEIPSVGPFTLYPREDIALNRYVFYLFPGLETQARALARFARGLPQPAAPAILAPRDAALDAAVEALGKACEGCTVERYGRESLPELAAKLATAKADPVFFLGSGAEAVALLRAAESRSWRPRLLVTAAASGPDLFAVPAAFDGRVFVALPAAPEPGPEAVARYRSLGPLPPEHLSAQLSALAAAEVLIQALERAGRDFDRESFIETLEGIQRFDPVYSPPVSYGPSRRLGVRGASIHALDLAARRLAPAGTWIDAD